MHPIDNLSLRAEGLPELLRRRLEKYYLAGAPDFAQARLEDELKCMSSAQAEEDFLICYELGRAAVRSGHILQVDGRSVGSMLVFLLLGSRINPLPAHYYCTVCGYSEIVETKTVGLDLERKNCPHCDVVLRRDGFSIPRETVWLSDGKAPPLEYHCSDGFFPYGLQVLKQFYSERNRMVIPRGVVFLEDGPLRIPVGINILPEDTCPEEFPYLLSYLADGSPCFSGSPHELQRHGIKTVILAVSNMASALKEAQDFSGLFSADIPLHALIGIAPHNVINTAYISAKECAAALRGDSSYYDFACVLTTPHNDYVHNGAKHPSLEAVRLRALRSFPLFCPEDVFDGMLAAGFDRELAAQAAEAVAAGKGVCDPEILEQLGMPENMAEAAGHCLHLYPRGSGAQKLVTLLLLAIYMQAHPAEYFRSAARILQKS